MAGYLPSFTQMGWQVPVCPGFIFDVLGKILPANTQEKLWPSVPRRLVWATALPPVSAVTSPALVLAHHLQSAEWTFLHGSFWGQTASLGSTLLVALLVAGLLPRVSAGVAAVVTGVSLIALLAAQSLAHQLGLCVGATGFACGGPGGGLPGVDNQTVLLTEAGKIKSDEESARNQPHDGPGHQGQGQLDMAFDRFRRVPMSDAPHGQPVNLALDFERKRQFNKAQAVYEHMALYNANPRTYKTSSNG